MLRLVLLVLYFIASSSTSSQTKQGFGADSWGSIDHTGPPTRERVTTPTGRRARF
jgi:hypothetical protein